MDYSIAEMTVEVLIIGSGPVGSTYARQLFEGGKYKKILMIDLGAQLSAKPGTNAKNAYLYNYNEDGLDALSQVVRGELTATSVPLQQPWPENLSPISQPDPNAPPTKYRLNSENPDQLDWDNMPAGASSFNVGGMGGHWTCCTPRPTPVERIPFIAPDEWDGLIERGEKLLQTNQVSFDGSLRGQVVKDTLAAIFDPYLPPGRKVQMLPLACKRLNPTWVEWTGADTVLGPLAESGVDKDQFELWPETICRRLIHHDGKVTGAEVEHLPSKTKRFIKVEGRCGAEGVVVVAANSFYTPQLLWASNIRPAALGHYLNDQPMLFGQIVLSNALLAKIGERWNPPPPTEDPVPIPYGDPIPQVWIPFSEEHPFHCQIHRDSFPYSILPTDQGVDHRAIIELRWFLRKDIRQQDCITFSERHQDMYGMPQITFHYTYSELDRKNINAAFNDITKAATALGGYLPGRETTVLPRGSSLHYMGTFRMGVVNDGQSVCDPYSKVWGFHNLYLGGNGIIPTATACNPTLTSVTLAIRACDKLNG